MRNALNYLWILFESHVQSYNWSYFWIALEAD